MGPDQPLTGVGKTALGMAMVRAREARQVDRLFDDPLAEAFLRAAPQAFSEERRAHDAGEATGGLAALGAMFFVHGAMRTRFYDDYLQTAASEGYRQVVLLAAGLDTRGYRLEWPRDTRLFELDLPEVLTFKTAILAEQPALPHCERIVVPVDLREELEQCVGPHRVRSGQANRMARRRPAHLLVRRRDRPTLQRHR